MIVGAHRPTPPWRRPPSRRSAWAAPSSCVLARNAVASPIPSRYFPDRALDRAGRSRSTSCQVPFGSDPDFPDLAPVFGLVLGEMMNDPPRRSRRIELSQPLKILLRHGSERTEQNRTGPFHARDVNS